GLQGGDGICAVTCRPRGTIDVRTDNPKRVLCSVLDADADYDRLAYSGLQWLMRFVAGGNTAVESEGGCNFGHVELRLR
ncbi:MAG: hypothetical protein Q7T59_04465, partial [Candidatus Woesebacteria bacterium]|nr:hypothetical protein [Candidatus Woesebacteria bacterium]